MNSFNTSTRMLNTANNNYYWTFYIQSDNTLTLYNQSGLGPYYSYNGASWSHNSDLRIKRDINPISSAINDILKLNPVYFNYNYDSPDQPMRPGFIAQEVELLFPSLVSNSSYSEELKDHIKGICTTELIPYLVKSIQEQQIQIESLKSDISDIKSQLQKMNLSSTNM